MLGMVGWRCIDRVKRRGREKKKLEAYAPRRKISLVAASLVWLVHARLSESTGLTDPPGSN
jgi:hypothetical protein